MIFFPIQDSIVVVRACEAALIIISLPTIGVKCFAQKMSFQQFCKQLSQKLAFLCQEIPEDMDTGDIEDCVSSWGYVLKNKIIFSLKFIFKISKKVVKDCFSSL